MNVNSVDNSFLDSLQSKGVISDDENINQPIR